MVPVHDASTLGWRVLTKVLVFSQFALNCKRFLRTADVRHALYIKEVLIVGSIAILSNVKSGKSSNKMECVRNVPNMRLLVEMEFHVRSLIVDPFKK